MRPGGYLQQADGTSWMAMYSLNMLTIALELAKENSAYEDIASKFFEHFLRIADAMDGRYLIFQECLSQLLRNNCWTLTQILQHSR